MAIRSSHMARIYYRWYDNEGEEHITRKPPEPVQSFFGGTYIPEATTVVVIPVRDDDSPDL
jgi:hypothetical protein